MGSEYFATFKAIRTKGPMLPVHLHRKVFILSLFFILSWKTFAQISKIDSLKSELSLRESSDRFSPDKEYIDVLNLLSESYFSNYPDSTLFFAEKSKQLCENLGYMEGLSNAYRNIGAYYNRQGNYDTAKVIFQTGIQLANRISYMEGLANLYASIALNYHETGFVAAATEYNLMSLKIKRSLGLNAEIANTLSNLGLIALDRNQLGNALDFFNEAKGIRQKLGDAAGILRLNANIALVLQKEGKYSEALRIFEEILADESTPTNKSLEAVTYFHVGEIYLARNEFEDAVVNFAKALNLDRELNDRYATTFDLFGLGEAYLKLNQFSKSRELIVESLLLAEESGIKQNISKGHRLLSELFEAQKNHEPALYHFKLYKIYQDSVFNSTTEKVADDLLITYELEKSSVEAQQIQRESELQREKEVAKLIRNGVIGLLLVMAFVLIITVRSYQIQRKARLLVTQQKNELERLYIKTNQQKDEIESIAKDLEEVNNTKDKLFSIVGHDLRSPINSLNSLMQYTMDENLSQEEFLQVSYKLKNEVEHVHFTLINLLHWAKSQMHGISTYPDFLDLNELVTENIELYKPISSSKNITLMNKMASKTYCWADREQINLVIRNLINNAVKFTSDGGAIQISSKLNNENFWEISLQDNGVGMGPEIIDKLFKPNFQMKRYGTAGEKGTGLGLILVKDFLERNNGSIWAVSEIGVGSTFTFTLPRAESRK